MFRSLGANRPFRIWLLSGSCWAEAARRDEKRSIESCPLSFGTSNSSDWFVLHHICRLSREMRRRNRDWNWYVEAGRNEMRWDEMNHELIPMPHKAIQVREDCWIWWRWLANSLICMWADLTKQTVCLLPPPRSSLGDLEHTKFIIYIDDGSRGQARTLSFELEPPFGLSPACSRAEWWPTNWLPEERKLRIHLV